MVDFDAIAQGMTQAVPFAGHLGLEITSISEGEAVVRLPERPELTNHVGSQHAGALFTLAETASGAAFVGAFFSGSLLIETLFSLDGLGLLSYESVIRRDYPVVLGTLYLFTLIGLVTKLVSDLCYVWVDPRVKFD